MQNIRVFKWQLETTAKVYQFRQVVKPCLSGSLIVDLVELILKYAHNEGFITSTKAVDDHYDVDEKQLFDVQMRKYFFDYPDLIIDFSVPDDLYQYPTWILSHYLNNHANYSQLWR